MVKLTAELIEQAAQYTNAVRDRELDLRGTSREVGGPPRAAQWFPPRRVRGEPALGQQACIVGAKHRPGLSVAVATQKPSLGPPEASVIPAPTHTSSRLIDRVLIHTRGPQLGLAWRISQSELLESWENVGSCNPSAQRLVASQ